MDFLKKRRSSVEKLTLEVELLTRIYNDYLERTKFIFNSALEFWNLYKPVRNAFSHTLRFTPSPRISMNGVPKGYYDLRLVLDKHWKEANPIKNASYSRY